MENNPMPKKKERRFSLSLKLNLLIVAMILITSVGLVISSYYVHSRQIKRIYYSQTELAAKRMSELIMPEESASFWDAINNDEFRSLRARALAEKNSELIREWMDQQPSFFGDEYPEYSLLDDYESICDTLLNAASDYRMQDIYIQYMENGVTYNLIDPVEDIFYIGSVEPEIDGFEYYGDNERVPATVYHSQYGWLCTACEPIWREGEPVAGLACADIDMNDVVEEMRLFLLNSALFILVLIAVSIVIGVVLIRRVAIQPLKILRLGTLSFKGDQEGYNPNMIIHMENPPNDEIGDLYEEIRSMQAHIVEYTDDLARATAERERIQTELDLAAKIQTSALPELEPDFSGRPEFLLSASMNPAKDVGGDFYDFFWMDGNRLALVIADVSGKGVPAALFMMSAKDMLSSRAAAGGSPAEILSDVNVQLCKNNQAKMFVTVWLGILDLNTGLLQACSAGHEEPAICRAGGAFELLHDKHGFVLGGLKRSKYQDYELRLQPGDAVFVYTDGVPEACDAEGNFYGTDRMVNALNTAGSDEPKDILAVVSKSVSHFVGDAEQFDDLTMLCIRYRGPNEKSENNTQEEKS